ncbi:MAG: methyltransferase domain-containing protein [Proteobacteria bacterium]|nr:methyltransferase domain-containing protein [Pseudomonadota bacterium]
MQDADDRAHDRAIQDQFTRQAPRFAQSNALHADDVLEIIVSAAAVGPGDRAIDLACGPGSVACALAQCGAHVVGLDATAAMLDQARIRAAKLGLSEIDWQCGSVYAPPFSDATFDAVTCRFAFHHLEDPPSAFRQMVRLAAPGARVVLCDGLASDEPAKAKAFNDMERWRDPSTVAFRTFGYLRSLFLDAGLGEPAVRRFGVTYSASTLIAGSFPRDGDRQALLRLIENSVATDALGMDAQHAAGDVTLTYRSAVLSAVVRV